MSKRNKQCEQLQHMEAASASQAKCCSLATSGITVREVASQATAESQPARDNTVIRTHET
jgi:hypothetical protein